MIPKLFKVKGLSMLPLFNPNTYVLIWKSRKYKVGDVVVIKTNSDLNILKRIECLSKDKVQVSSDNNIYSSKYTDALFSHRDILGKVIYNFRPSKQ
tara:strand:- start:526 stop:813 length:288 start_codon:yes stop_codon:yes gene_type:complete